MSANPADLMTITEFCHLYPEYAFSPGRTQAKCWNPPTTLPIELAPLVPGPVHSKRGQPNPNQTLTHHQCRLCRRVLRNDQFSQPEQYTRQNVGNPYCRECLKGKGAARYRRFADEHTALRLRVWQHIAPACVACGFDKHTAAMEMHHVRGKKQDIVAHMVKSFAAAPSVANAEKLATEVAKCIPLCANCHRLLHAGAIDCCESWQPSEITVGELLGIAGCDPETMRQGTQPPLLGCVLEEQFS